jgi:hypothetical protein
MPVLRLIFFVLLFCVPLTAKSGVSVTDFPGNTVWYAHADLEQMRSADSGKGLYNWLDGEVFVEIHEEVGIDIGKETNRITAFADTEHGSVIIVDGPVSQESRDKMLAIATLETELELLNSGGKTYYQFGDADEDSDTDLDALEDGGFFSFDVKDKIIVTSTEEQIKTLLGNNGKIPAMDVNENALFVLSADKSLVQAGLRTDELADDDDDWDSNILRNTKQAALLIADSDGLIAIEAQLVSSEPGMAQSLGNIISGLIALQAFNDELDPDLVSLIQNTKVEVNGSTLSINTVIDPALIISILDDD